MDLCGLFPNDSLLNFHFPNESFNSLLCDQADTMAAMVPNESVLSNQTFDYYPPVFDKDQFWAHFLNQDGFAENHEKKEEISGGGSHIDNPAMAPYSACSNHSGMEEQDSEVFCAEEQQSGVSDNTGSKKSSEGEIVDSKYQSKKRKRNTEKGPKYAFKTRTNTDALDDGFKWRKYGKKTIKSSPHPRSYYKCSESNCGVKKRVERDPSDREVLITTYEGNHNHKSPCPTEIYCITDPMTLAQSYPLILVMNEGLRSCILPNTYS